MIISSILFKFLSILNAFLPKNEKLILLYANLGFRDNIEVLYRCLLEKGYPDRYQIICISNHFYSLQKDRRIHYVSPALGVFYFLHAKYFFYCAGKYPIKPSKKQMVVNLWHGIPLKKIGNLLPENKDKDYNFFTKLIYYSPLFKPIMKEAFNASEQQLLLAGNLRNDDLRRPTTNLPNKKKVLWMPTYRQNERFGKDSEVKTLIFNLENHWLELQKFLKKSEIILYLKLHPLEESRINIPKECINIQLISDEELSKSKTSLYSFLGAMDALITDYSSVYFDYLLLNRPLAFVLDDYDSYKNKRGFVFEDILSLMPGDKIYNFAELLNFLDKFDKQIDNYQDQRNRINQLVNPIQQNFCEDLLNKISL